MSLNKQQRQVTSEELKAHFHESTLSFENIAHEMNISVEEVERVLNMDVPNGFFGNKLQKFIHLVWDIRDLINDNIRQNGDQPKDYTYLKGEKEDYWFLQ